MDDQAQVNLLNEDQSSRQKRKQFFILVSIILFTLIICAIISIFTVLKRHTESQSLSANPIAAVRSACRVTRYYYPCIKSLSSLHNHAHKIHPPDIFRHSIRAAFHEFYSVNILPQNLASKIKDEKIKPALTDCQSLITNSLTQLNRSLIMATNYVSPEEEILAFDEEMMKDLRNSVAQATNNVGRCLDGLVTISTTQRQIVKIERVKVRIQNAEVYVLNSLAILENENAIDKMFDPSFQSILASFILNREQFVLTVAVLCWQYLVLVFLFCVLMRVFMSRTRK